MRKLLASTAVALIALTGAASAETAACLITKTDTNPFFVKMREGADAKAKELGNQIAQTEKDIIEQALFKNNFSRTHTAKDLGISRVTLYNKMKKFGLL